MTTGIGGTKILLLLPLGAAMLLLAQAQQTPQLSFSAAQSDQGRIAYEQNCASCHGDNLNDGRFGPPLRGQAFRQKWAEKTVGELLSYIATSMPPAQPGALGDTTYAALVAAMLEANGLRPGTRELSPDPTKLQGVRMPLEVPSGQQQLHEYSLGVSANANLPSWPAPPNPLNSFRPVTDALLSSPPREDWLTWRRGHDDSGYSPLDEIKKENVERLRVAWSLTLPPGPNLATPLVHDGVIFVHSYGDHLQALDAVTGDELWHYARRLPQGRTPAVQRSFALYGDKVYLSTSDAHVVALNAKTGDLVWDRSVNNAGERWNTTGGPLVAKGKVMQGVNGQGSGGAYIVALDAETGVEAWRFHTVARPDEPGGNTWNGLPLEKRSGGSVWTSGSYDPRLNLAFFGAAPTYDTGPLRNSVNQPGMTNKALYTGSTIALNPDTGKLVWFYQHMPNDQWDLDWAFERQVIELSIEGETKKLVVTSGKPGIYDAVDAASGHYEFSFDMGLQNFVTAIDPKTGAKTIDPKLIPGAGEVILVCPHAVGGRNWIPGAYNPVTKLLYVPAVEACMQMIPVEQGARGFVSTGVRLNLVPRPDGDGRYGRLQAINLATKQTQWTERQRAAQTTGVLATAGGLVFAGALDRWLTAYDDASGKPLWRVRLNDVPNSSPITYMVGGKQYLAIVVGYGGIQPSTFAGLTPEIPLPVARSSAIWVFALR